MYFTSGSDRAFEQLMQTRPGADHFDSGEAGAPEDCGTCRFYRPHWKYQFCVYEECPYQPGKRTALDGAVKFQVKGVDDEMAVFRVEKNRGYTVMSNHHLRNKDLSLKAKGLLSQMLSLPEDWDFTLKGLCNCPQGFNQGQIQGSIRADETPAHLFWRCAAGRRPAFLFDPGPRPDQRGGTHYGVRHAAGLSAGALRKTRPAP